MGIKQRLTADADVRQSKTATDTKVVINVGGVRHETWTSTLECVPGTRLALLAHLQTADEAYDASNDEYFFDRQAKAFEAILLYYRTGELHVDQSICGNVMSMELDFWGLEESEIEPCCWGVYSRNTEHKQTLAELDENFAYDTTNAWEEVGDNKYKKWQLNVWTFLEEPGSSRWAKVYAIVSMFFVALSICLFVLETHKLFQVDRKTGKSMIDVEPEDEWTPTGSPMSCCCEQEYNKTKAIPETHPALLYLDYVCVSFFIIELVLRFAFCPFKRKFWKDLLNVIDLVCIIPYMVSIIIRTVEVDANGNVASILKIVIMLRIVRVLRIFKLMKHYSAFKILVYTLKVSTKELFLMVVFLMSGVLMFASLIHYIERDNFPNIPIGIWWALVTMTTVGYGDKYTVSMVGYVVGSACVVCGVLVIAFTVPIVVNNFSLYYSHAQTRIKAPNKKKRREKTSRSLKHIISQKQRQLKKRQTDTSFESIPNSLTSREPSGLTTDDEKPLTNNTQSKYNRILKNAKDSVFKADDFESAGSGRRTKSSSVEPLESPVTAREVTIEDMEDDACVRTARSEAPAKKNDYAKETRKIMGDMQAQTNRKQFEQKRQSHLIRQRRELRAQKLRNTPRDPPQADNDKESDA